LFKKLLGFLMESMIGLGQAFLKIDGIGVDSLIIGFVVMGLVKVREKI
jgi:hypothetical protein